MLNLAILRKWSGLTLAEVSVLLTTHAGVEYGIEAISRHESTNPSAFRTPPPAVMKAYATIYKVDVFMLYQELYSEADLRKKVQNERGLLDGNID